MVVSDASLSVLGILSERDVVRVIARHGASALDDQVSRHMTPKVITVTPDDTIEHVMQTMTDGRFRHVPVVDGGRLTGIISPALFTNPQVVLPPAGGQSHRRTACR